MKVKDSESSCEWNPRDNIPAYQDDEWHADADYSIGSGKNNFHVCERCKNLKNFRCMKWVKLKKGTAGTVR